MSFADLPSQPPPINPAAVRYISEVMHRSEVAQRHCDVSIDNSFGPNYWNKLDVYGRFSGKSPVLFFLHGGAWTSGTKEWIGFMAPAFIAASMLFVAPNYRLAPDYNLDAQIEDCGAALTWVFENIERFGGDREKVFVGGHSAGGYLAAMLTLDERALQERGLPRNLVRGCIPVSGIFDLRVRGGLAPELTNHLRTNVAPAGADWQRLSPITRIRRNPCPFFISAADQDLRGLALQALKMTEALRAHGGAAKCAIYAGYDHFTLNSSSCDPGHPWFSAVREWIYTGGPRSPS
jgi:arylformamidase